MESVMHPLQNAWCFWEHFASNKKSFLKNMEAKHEFDSIEIFWGKFQQMFPPTKMSQANITGISLFKRGIKPVWEDEANTHGGEWHFSIGGEILQDIASFVHFYA